MYGGLVNWILKKVHALLWFIYFIDSGSILGTISHLQSCSRFIRKPGSAREMLFFLVIRSLSLIKMICSLVFMTFDLVENKGTSWRALYKFLIFFSSFKNMWNVKENVRRNVFCLFFFVSKGIFFLSSVCFCRTHFDHEKLKCTTTYALNRKSIHVLPGEFWYLAALSAQDASIMC